MELLVSPASKVLNNWFEVEYFHDYFSCCMNHKFLPRISIFLFFFLQHHKYLGFFRTLELSLV